MLRDWLSAWRYERSPEAGGKRDLRIDLLRGFCIFVMTVDHVGGETSWLYALTGGNGLIVSAAEGFVLLSGMSMGMVHHITIRNRGMRAMFEKVFGRVWLLYAATVLLTLTFAAVSTAVGAPYTELATPATSRVDFAFSVITFHRTYSLTDVLVLYTLLVLMAGPLLWLISHGHSGPVLAGSITAWTVTQLWPGSIPRAWQITDGGFPFSAWQLLFVIGLLVGYHRQRIVQYLQVRWLLTYAFAFAVALFFVDVAINTLLAPDPNPIAVHELLYDKNDAGVGRVLAMLGLASFVYALVTVFWAAARRMTGWLLLPMGRNALFAYAVQLFVVAFFASVLVAPIRLDRENALFQAAAVGMVWLACLIQPPAMRRLRRLTGRGEKPALVRAP